ncbi:MAG: PorP/SprF family type IX secretion system membrane protein [Bacteroidia bacterium]|nr:PorP/SprF family type IX secretion system membrane protein [Bacteroidia bacterium]
MIKRFLVIIVTLLIIKIDFVQAQDPQFSQFYANPLYLNPAFAGSERCPRVNVAYRNQWPALGSTYVTYSGSYDQHVNKLEGGCGLHIMQDVQGDGAIKTLYINGMYAYTAPITRNFALKGGFQASYIQRQLKMDFIFPDMIHPLYGPIYQTAETSVPTDNTNGFFDFSAGLIGYNKTSYFGFAVHHLTEPSESFRGNSDAVLPRKYTVHFGTTIPLSSMRFKRNELSISPNILFQQQQRFQQLNYGFYLNRNSICGGIWFRQNFNFHYDAFIMLLGFVQDKFKFSYSYDLTVSKLRNQTLGAHEVTLSATFNCRTPKKKFRTISCPSF